MPTRARAPVLDDTTIPGALLPLPSSAPLTIAVVATEVVPFMTSVVISVALFGAAVTTAVSVIVTSGSLRTAGATAVVVLMASLAFASGLLTGGVVFAGLIIVLTAVAVCSFFRIVRSL